MALIKCSECGKEISDKATVCLNCGNPIQKSKKGYSLLSDSEKEQVEEQMKEYGTFNDLSILIFENFKYCYIIIGFSSILFLIYGSALGFIIFLIGGCIGYKTCTNYLDALIESKMRKFYYENNIIFYKKNEIEEIENKDEKILL